MMNKETLKQEYYAPEFQVQLLKMEEGIAAGSARVTPTNTTGEVRKSGLLVMTITVPLSGNFGRYKQIIIQL
ncbi:hypothetical protein [Elizabethkingia meningoseptica]|uniref:hypothetical protein n=1 Tax=Elizabethkingia meningoseptica TaxID=238 RepID=UPI0016246BEC|nr:hypothetical protein [Elizabethkingia meningoseptica]